jgi:hypothetical protein
MLKSVLNLGAKSVGEYPSVTRRAALHSLLDIFERYGVYVGGHLQYSDLVKEWSRSGFRRGDFEQSLDDALGFGLLGFAISDSGEPFVALMSTEIPAPTSGSRGKRLGIKALGAGLSAARTIEESRQSQWNGVDRRQNAGLSGSV